MVANNTLHTCEEKYYFFDNQFQIDDCCRCKRVLYTDQITYFTPHSYCRIVFLVTIYNKYHGTNRAPKGSVQLSQEDMFVKEEGPQNNNELSQSLLIKVKENRLYGDQFVLALRLRVLIASIAEKYNYPSIMPLPSFLGCNLRVPEKRLYCN